MIKKHYKKCHIYYKDKFFLLIKKVSDLIFSKKNREDQSTYPSTFMQALEARYMYDGAAMQTVDLADGVSDYEKAQVLDAVSLNDHADASKSLLEAVHANDLINEQMDYSVYKEVVIIDSSVKDPQTIIKNISRKASIEIVDMNKNGVDAISDILSKYKDLDAVHLISHGIEGQLYLGNMTLNLNNVSSYQDSLSQWGNSLSDNGDLLLYGCDVAKGSDGLAFIDALKNYTQADIAASTDMTAGDLYHGNSLLEVKNSVEIKEILSFSDYQHVLTAPTVLAGSTLNYTIGDPETVIDSNISVSDPDSNIVSATIQITSNYVQGEDILTLALTSDSISSNFDAVNGILTITGSDTAEIYDAALHLVQYQNLSLTPSTLSREISWTVNDGTLDSNIATSTINIVDAGSTPFLSYIDYVSTNSNMQGNNIRNGYSVSISSYGNVFAFGAPYANTMSGTVTIGGQVINGNPSSQFGFSVSLNSDGSYLAVSAPFDDSNGIDSGSVSIYQNSGGAWNLVGSPIVGLAAYDQIGYSVSLSADGSMIAIGSPLVDSNGADSGSVSIYQYNGGSWNLVGSPIVGLASGDQAGYSVSLSANGLSVAIGSPLADSNGTDSGSTLIYQYNGSSWNLVGSPIVGLAAGDQSGYSVSFNAAGSMLAIGAPFNDTGGTDAGSVRVFELNGGAWSQSGIDLYGNLDYGNAGFSVSLNADNSYLAVGIPGSEQVVDTYQGKALVYKYQSNNWIQYNKDLYALFMTNPQGYQTGYSVSLAQDTLNVGIGSPATFRGGNTSSIAFYYILRPSYITHENLTYVIGYPEIPIYPSFSISDSDSTTMKDAKIKIKDNYIEGEDILSFTQVGNINGSFDSVTGVLTLSGIDTIANYQKALALVTYQNISADPSFLQRTVEFTVNDGTNTSNVITTSLSIAQGVNPPPPPPPDEPYVIGGTEDYPVFNGSQTMDFVKIIPYKEPQLSDTPIQKDFLVIEKIEKEVNGNLILLSKMMESSLVKTAGVEEFQVFISEGEKINLFSVLNKPGVSITIVGLSDDQGEIDVKMNANEIKVDYIANSDYQGAVDFIAKVYKDHVLEGEPLYFRIMPKEQENKVQEKDQKNKDNDKNEKTVIDFSSREYDESTHRYQMALTKHYLLKLFG